MMPFARALGALLASASVLMPVPLRAADAPELPTFADVGLYSIREGDLVGLVDRRGHVVFAPEFEELKLGDGRAVIVKDKKYGYIDKSGRVVVPAIYSYARPFEHGLAFVLDRGRSMYIDDKGSVVWSKP